jgi:hypothetical protein
MNIMKIFTAILLIPVMASAEKPYFQQGVSYDIKVELDPETAILAGIENIVYINNSADTLREVYFHLYYNAFQPGSYLDKQDRERGYYDISNLPEDERGEVKIDNIEIDGGASDQYIIDNTVMTVPLTRPLTPGDSVVFYIEFTSRIPAEGSRTAYRGKHFDIGQWYPKPAVYDRYGWHAHQYMDHEFYADYADFHVEITLPSEFIVAHMGRLLNEEEIFGGKLPVPEGDSIIVDALSIFGGDSTRSEPPDEEPDSDSTEFNEAESQEGNIAAEAEPADSLYESNENEDLKTWKIIAENVHDFAFCADPRFVVDICRYNDTIVKSYYTKRSKKRWETKAVEYTRQALNLYSERYFPYPYGQYSTVASLVGGGMEYPQLTMISQVRGSRGEEYLSMESVIAHEVGHAWFYGILGFNETEQSFLDEGLTSFATIEYMEHYHGRRHNNFVYKKSWQKRLLPNGDERNDNQKRYISRALMQDADPMITPANLFKDGGRYYSASYYKASSVYFMLQYTLGEERFYRFLRHLLDKWAFKHPYLSDLQDVAEEVYGGNLDWFFRQWFTTNWTLDYALTKFKTKKKMNQGETVFNTTIGIEKKGRCISPLDVVVYFDQGRADTIYFPVDLWFDGRLKYDTTLVYPHKPHKAKINPDARLADVNPLNNSSGLSSIHWQFMVPRFIYNDNYVENYIESYTFSHNPTAWYNTRDGVRLGYSLEGSYLDVAKVLNLDLSAGLNNGKVNYDIGCTDRFFGINPNLQYYFRSREIEGRGRQETGIYWDRRSRWGGDFSRTALSAKRTYLYDSDYLYGDNWSGGNVITVDLDISRHDRRRRASIFYGLSLSSSIPGTAYDFTRAKFDLALSLIGIAGYDTRIKLLGGIADGTVPMERQFFLSSADPYEIWESPLYRSRGTLPDEWKVKAHLFKPGGGGLTGYLDQGLTGTRMVSARLERDLPRVKSPVSIPYLTREIRRVQPVFCAATGYVWDKPDKIAMDDLLSEAGLILVYKIPYLDLFMSENKLSLYLPLWISDPRENDDSFKWRWVFAITP